MKAAGIILIAAGIFMLLYKGFSFTYEKKLADIGPVEIKKKEKENVTWPMYAGIIAIGAGVFAIVAANRKNHNTLIA